MAELRSVYTTLKKVVTEIQPGHRVQVLVPRSISHEGDEHNWDNLENIQMDICGAL